MKEKIVDMALKGSGVRDTGRVLSIGINTVMRTLKSSRQNKSPRDRLFTKRSHSSVNWINKDLL
ncbi:IS1-like element transposase [Xenorhabdus bovienii]|uniref:IS1-like element transposase n=2 Tax=Xenorhabdus bovienii TaxID=40576 RepID=UPI002392B5CD|nr:hypothetical protein [Xenorhabdus bovienii]MDE1481806.1 hypothetical protein [Xenorhabdus bovienii]MDE9427892.1 hypothetical protein [Xenorhabdus bovienii]MDE9431519.1 hypothetical protein [Xenorhabdus bovienii]MDE9440632.1 hypothetical protein [Xenorhabdus bovienii]